MAQQFRFRELSQTFIIRNLGYPLLSIRNDTVYLCLLTHYLRNMDSIGILGRPPRKFPPMQCIPSENFPLQCCDLIRLHSFSQNKKRSKNLTDCSILVPFFKRKKSTRRNSFTLLVIFSYFRWCSKEDSAKTLPEK